MRLWVALVLSVLLTSAVSAAEKGTPEYARLVEIKKAQRAQREAEKANPSPKAKGFWQREAERSGFAGTGAMFTNALGSAIPLEKPKAWKDAAEQ